MFFFRHVHTPCLFYFLFLRTPPPPTSTLFPYTTLFRSPRRSAIRHQREHADDERPRADERRPEDDDVSLQHHGADRAENRQHDRSEEHTSELQSRSDLVCRLLLEKKNRNDATPHVLDVV